MATLDSINRTITCDLLPDFRKRVTQRFDIVDGQATMGDGTKFDANVRLPWGDENPDYAGCRLVAQRVVGQTENPNKSPNNPPAYLLRVWEELPRNDRIIVGEPGVSYNQYGFQEIVLTYIQFSDGTTVYTDTVGTSAAPAPYAAAILKTVEGEDDGTIRTYKLTYTTGGEMADDYTLNLGGNLIIRTLTYLNQVPPTPSGYTLFGPGVEYILGLPLYRYRFSAVNGGGVPGTAAEVGRSYYNAQGGAVQFNPASPTTADGTVKCVIEYITAQTVTVNPIPLPSGFVLVGLDQQQSEGYTRWTGTYYYADGLVVDEVNIQVKDALVVYHRISYGTAPTTPTQTIGGTVTLFESSVFDEDGYVRYDYRWAEGDGQSSITTDADPDGALNYTVVTFTAAASTPAYPGTGTAYLVRLTQNPQNGYFQNTAVYKKPPATLAYKKTMGFEEPGIAEFVGSPPQFVLRPPKQRTLIADVEISFGITQDSTAAFDIEAYGSFYETYTPTDTGVAVQTQRGLGGYLAQASGISGTNSNYNGVLCDAWEAELLSSIPSTFPTGTVRLKTDNEPYLTDITGVQVFRRTAISYSF